MDHPRIGKRTHPIRNGFARFWVALALVLIGLVGLGLVLFGLVGFLFSGQWACLGISAIGMAMDIVIIYQARRLNTGP